MKRLLLALISCLAISSRAHADYVKIGSAAPQFTLKSSKGENVELRSFSGKTVVLEWFNPNCPFVKKFYTNGDMQRFQKEALAKGVVWLTINSSAAGKQGHITLADAPALVTELGIQSSALLLDSDGAVGRSYGARTTPHVFVIDAQGKLAYQGAIDATPSTRPKDIASAQNYLLLAIEALARGLAPQPADTEPYGCSIKYAQ